MKLLVVTQAVDMNDPVLGFFHRWIEEFAKHYERVGVICLREGEHALPANVHVHSLGKETGAKGRGAYALRFLSLVWRLRRDYDAVFVHMNQEYILIAGWLWILLNKRIYLWRNHYAGSWRTDIAAAFSKSVFYTSVHSYTAKYRNAIAMPVGVDTERFTLNERVARQPHSILFLARAAPSKRPEMFINALALVAQSGTAFTASCIGSPLPADRAYYEGLKEKVRTLGLMGRISFLSGVPNSETPNFYRSHEIFVNASPSGMLDKTLFEAAASGCRVLAASQDFATLVGPESQFNSTAELAKRLIAALKMQAPPAPASFTQANSLAALGARFAQVLALRPRRLRSFVWLVLYKVASIIPHPPRMTVLLYHSISDSSDFFAVSPDVFEKQMQYLKKNVAVVPLVRAFAHAAGERVARDSVAVTLDDGYRDFLTTVMPILKKAGVPATVFVLGDAPDRRELGNDIPLLAAGDFAALTSPLIAVGSHGLSHRKLSKMPEADARQELTESRTMIAGRVSASAHYLAYPKGSYNTALKRIAKEVGFAGAVSVIERGVKIGDDAYALPRIQVDSSTTDTEFHAKLSPAADWYYRLWSFVKHQKAK